LGRRKENRTNPRDPKHPNDPLIHPTNNPEREKDGQESVQAYANDDHGGKVETKGSKELSHFTQQIAPIPLHCKSPHNFNRDHDTANNQVCGCQVPNQEFDARPHQLRLPHLPPHRNKDTQVTGHTHNEENDVDNYNYPGGIRHSSKVFWNLLNNRGKVCESGVYWRKSMNCV
jgi:hypothetical protein